MGEERCDRLLGDDFHLNHLIILVFVDDKEMMDMFACLCLDEVLKSITNLECDQGINRSSLQCNSNSGGIGLWLVCGFWGPIFSL